MQLGGRFNLAVMRMFSRAGQRRGLVQPLRQLATAGLVVTHAAGKTATWPLLVKVSAGSQVRVAPL